MKAAKRGVFSTEGMNLGCWNVPEREHGAAEHRRLSHGVWRSSVGAEPLGKAGGVDAMGTHRGNLCAVPEPGNGPLCDPGPYCLWCYFHQGIREIDGRGDGFSDPGKSLHTVFSGPGGISDRGIV